jgi:N-methylhydantoinase A
MTTSYVVAVDSGGTFSDCVAIASDGAIARAKATSTPPDYSVGVLESVRRVAEELAMPVETLLRRTVLFGHGTTVATNTLLTRTGSATGLLTTRGHEDALIIGRTFQKAAGLGESELSDVAGLDKAVPLVPRALIQGVHERIDARGQVVAPLDLESVRGALDRLVSEGVESVAICLLWSFLNPMHEEAIRALIEGEYPQLNVSVSSELAPVIKEYERAATTVMNAYLARRTAHYLDALRERIAAHGFQPMPVVMQSSGGVLSMDRAKSRAVGLLTSGPAGGVIGAQVLGRILGYPNIITTDVGGTSFDVGLVVDGHAQFSTVATFDKYQIILPVIDVSTIGAGGGSIAWLEPDTGVLRVGPQSAGARPGPVCYGLGGTEPTVTDANVVLGRINPDYFLGGRQRLDRERSHRAVERIARMLGLDVAETAMGIVDIVDAHMADLVRKVTLERGYDARDFVLFAFGGAGPMHAAAYGPAAGCTRMLAPALASEFSAFGIAGTDVMVAEELSAPMFAPFDIGRLGEIYAQLETKARRDLLANGIAEDRMYVQRYVRLRYRGQVHEVDTPVPGGPVGPEQLAETLAAFERIYETKYGRGTTYKHAGLQAMTYRVHGFGRLYPPVLASRPSGDPDPRGARKAERPVYFRETGGFTVTPIYAAEQLAPGHDLSGPAVVEASDTTVVIHPGQGARVDAYLNLLLEAREA